MILSLFVAGLCSSGLGMCLTIKMSVCANTFIALYEKYTNGFITRQVSCSDSLNVTVSFCWLLPIRFWFVIGMADVSRNIA